MATKTFLDQAGAQYLVNKIQQIIDTKISAEEAAALITDAVVPASAQTAGVVKVGSGLSISDGVLSANAQSIDFANLNNIPTTLAGYGIEDAASAQDLEEVRAAVTNVYHFRGSVADRAALAEIQNPEDGDVYNIAADGMNVAWVQPVGGQGFWDDFGTTVDLTGYVREDDLQAILTSEFDAMFMKYMPMETADLASVKKAFATTGDVINIKLTDDIVADASITVPTGKTAKIDLNGQDFNMGNKNLNVYGDLVISGEGEMTGTGKTVQVFGGSITMNEGKLVSTGNQAITAENNAVVTINGGEIESQETAIAAYTGTTVNINGGEITGRDNMAVSGNGTAGAGGYTINISGGTLIGNIESAGYQSCAVYGPNEGVINITGGTIIANNGAGVVMRGGELNMTGGSIQVMGTAHGWVGDRKTKLNASGIIYDYQANYPAKDTLAVYVGPDAVIHGVDADVQIYKGAQETPNVTVENGANIAIAEAPEA